MRDSEWSMEREAELRALIKHLLIVVAVAVGLSLFSIWIYALGGQPLPIPWWGYFLIVLPPIFLVKLGVVVRLVRLQMQRARASR